MGDCGLKNVGGGKTMWEVGDWGINVGDVI